MNICESCKKEIKYGGVSLGDEKGYESLCNDCYNKKMANEMGIKKPFPDYQPIIIEDSEGIPHTFITSVMLFHELSLEAVEFEDNKFKPYGYNFKIMVDPETDPMEAFNELYNKIKTGLSRKYISLNENFNPQINKDNTVIGRIDEPYDDNYNDKLVFSIDGNKYTLKELEKALSPYVGFNFKISIYDPYDDVK